MNGGVEKTQKSAGTWMQKRGNGMARRVRDQVGSQSRNLATAEEKIVEHVRGNPALYLFGIALVIGLLVAKLVMESHQARRAPLL